MSQVLTTPSESLVIVTPSLAYRVMDLIIVEDIDLEPVPIVSVNGMPIYQNLIDWSSDAVMREEEEENTRVPIPFVCPTKVSIR